MAPASVTAVLLALALRECLAFAPATPPALQALARSTTTARPSPLTPLHGLKSKEDTEKAFWLQRTPVAKLLGFTPIDDPDKQVLLKGYVERPVLLLL